MLRRPPDLPNPLIRMAPVGQRRVHLALEHGPAPLVKRLAGPGVEIHGVQQHPPHIVLALIPSPVADPDRAWPRRNPTGDRGCFSVSSRSPPIPYMIWRSESPSAMSEMK